MLVAVRVMRSRLRTSKCLHMAIAQLSWLEAMFSALASDSEAEAPTAAPKGGAEGTGLWREAQQAAGASALRPQGGHGGLSKAAAAGTWREMISVALKPLKPAIAGRVRDFLGSQDPRERVEV